MRKYTVYGYLAVVIWSTGAAFCRTLTEDWGLMAGALVNLLAGAAAVAVQCRRCGWGFWRGRNAKFWASCGALYTLYVLTNYASSVFAVDRAQVMALTVIKSAWPILAYVFLFAVQKKRRTARFYAKVAILTAGLLVSNLVTAGVGELTAARLLAYVPAVGLGLLSSVAWALYSNLLGVLDTGGGGDCSGVFMLCAGAVAAVAALWMPGSYAYPVTAEFTAQLLFNSLVGVTVANLMWNRAVTAGNCERVFSFSNLLPVISVCMSSLILGVDITAPVLAGSVLVLAGTVLGTYGGRPQKRAASRRIRLGTK